MGARGMRGFQAQIQALRACITYLVWRTEGRLMHRKPQEGSAASSNGAAGAFTFPDPPASSMGIIPHHADIAREDLAEEYPLMRLAPLAVTLGELLLRLHISIWKTLCLL